jgi:hypothetical protein
LLCLSVFLTLAYFPLLERICYRIFLISLFITCLAYEALMRSMVLATLSFSVMSISVVAWPLRVAWLRAWRVAPRIRVQPCLALLAFLLFVLGILSGNRRIELSSCTAPTLYQEPSFSSLVELERKRSQEPCNTSETRRTSYGQSGCVGRNP